MSEQQKGPFKLIRKTIKGETTVGRVANKVLPFPKVRDALGAAIKGTKQGLPVPEFEEANLEEKVKTVKRKVEDADGKEIDPAQLVNDIYDILDDGKINDTRALSLKTRKYITKAFSALPIVAYIIYAVISGDFSLQELARIIGA